MATISVTGYRYRRTQQGFTLLELVLSMSLTALLLGMLSAGVYSVVNEWQRETSGLDDSIDKTLVMLQLERAMLAAWPHSYINKERLSRFVYFTGTSSELRFVSTVSPQRHNGLTAWDIVSDPTHGLALKLTPAFSDNPDERFAQLQPVSLLKNYEGRFRYLVQRNNEVKEWLDEWPAETMQSLPLAIQLILTPIDSARDTEVLEILAPVRVQRHDTIEPSIPAI